MQEETKALKEFSYNSMGEITNFMENMDYDAILKAKDLIRQAEKNKGRVHVTGIGKPGHVAGYVASLLSSTGTPAYELHGTEAIHGSSGQVMPGDVVIAISNSGTTQELKSTFDTIKNNGASIIGVTGNKNSWLAKDSDVFLFAGVNHEGDTLNKPPRSSIIAEVAVLQVLSVALQYDLNLEEQEYIKWHPGGALGNTKKGDK